MCRLPGMSVKVDSREIVNRQSRYVVLLDIVAKSCVDGLGPACRRRDRFQFDRRQWNSQTKTSWASAAGHALIEIDEMDPVEESVFTPLLDESVSRGVTLDLGCADDDRLGRIA